MFLFIVPWFFIKTPFLWNRNLLCIRLYASYLTQLQSPTLGAVSVDTVIDETSLVLEHCKHEHSQLRGFCAIQVRM